MESIIERINQHKFWHFHGGIHPPEQKTLTSTKPIRQLPLPKQLILPLQQHIGRQGDLLVKVGDKVLKGQPLTESTNPMAVPLHAPTSGIISDIKKAVIAHPSGLSELCIFLDVDFEDTWLPREICQDFTKLSKQEIISKIADAGIVGMGGAGFPTHIKINTKPDINFLIINAAECEPYITADDLLMCEQSEAIIDGVKILDHLLNPAFILIGIEDNKPKAIKALQQATKAIEKIKVCVLPTKYPTGGEKQLIKILTGKEVKSGSLPIHSGIVVQNVATCFAICDAVIHDTPLIKRVVTLTGQALSKPQNVWALLGTPISFLLEQAGFIDDSAINKHQDVNTKHSVSNSRVSAPPVIMGGPLMGFSILNESVPIVKTSNCILAPSKTEMPSAFDHHNNEVECIRCGQCSDVCPSQLLPQELQWSAKAKDHQQLTKLNLFDCIDCGACAYVCPSQIPLVQYYRIAKAEIRQQQQLDSKSEKAKLRFEARKLRLEKEKLAREDKHKKAAAARKATMNKKSADGSSASSAVAAALARVKAKKEASESKENKGEVNELQVASGEESAAENINNAPVSTTEKTDDKSQVKAAIARAKAKRLAKNKHSDETQVTSSEATVDDSPTSTTEQSDIEQSATEKNNDKSQVKAAIARAKAKRLAKNNKANESQVTYSEESLKETNNETTGKEATDSTSKDNNIDKKAKIAAAIAKAKAKKEAKNTVENTAQEIVSNKDNSNTTTAVSSEDKKARIAAAVAKAKAKANAKKAQAEQSKTSDNETQSSLQLSKEESE